jgi:hypothetical protein
MADFAGETAAPIDGTIHNDSASYSCTQDDQKSVIKPTGCAVTQLGVRGGVGITVDDGRKPGYHLDAIDDRSGSIHMRTPDMYTGRRVGIPGRSHTNRHHRFGCQLRGEPATALGDLGRTRRSRKLEQSVLAAALIDQ